MKKIILIVLFVLAVPILGAFFFFEPAYKVIGSDVISNDYIAAQLRQRQRLVESENFSVEITDVMPAKMSPNKSEVILTAVTMINGVMYGFEFNVSLELRSLKSSDELTLYTLGFWLDLCPSKISRLESGPRLLVKTDQKTYNQLCSALGIARNFVSGTIPAVHEADT